jgi:RND family efflux transporter MFP subunit
VFLFFIPGPEASNRPLDQEQDEVVLEANGYLNPITQVQVSPRVSGQVTELYFEEGTRVKEGQVLARIDPTSYEFDWRMAEARLAIARARLDEARAGTEQKKGPANPRLEVHKAEATLAEVELAKAKWVLDSTQVRSPITGTVLAKHVDKGNTVNPLSFTLRGSICDIADLTKMEVEVQIQDRDFAKVFKGQKCKVVLHAFPETVYKGEVSRLWPVGDRAKGTIPVRVRLELPKDDARARPEMGARVVFLGKTRS